MSNLERDPVELLCAPEAPAGPAPSQVLDCRARSPSAARAP